MPHLSLRGTTLSVVAVLSVLTLAACSDSATVTRPIQPTVTSFGKTATGSNSRMIFASARDGNTELYSMNADGSDQVRLTNSPKTDFFGVYSPDGKRIAFTSFRDNPQGDIYTMNADGSGVVRLTYASGEEPSWSKDGKQIVFVSTRDAADPANPTDNDLEIYVVNADGTGTVRLTTNAFAETEPVFSPDGRQIAFVSGRDHPGTFSTDLYVMNVDGSQVTRLTTQAGWLTYPSWDPHSRRIAFAVEESSPNTGIYVLDVASRGLTRLTFGGALADDHPSWSPDGNKLAFTSQRDGPSHIYSMNADGTGQTRLTNFSEDYVRWSR